MKIIFKICDKCKGTNIQSLVPKLQEIVPDAQFDIRCHNLCGIGRTKPFVIINHIPVIADNEKELIEKVKDYIQAQS